MTAQRVKNLLVFGDSWPAGEELANPGNSCFPYVISQKLGLELKNYSQPSTSIDQALHRMLHDVDDFGESIVLFCLTGKSRSMIIRDRDETLELHPLVATPASTAYYKYIHSDKLDEFNRIRNILAAQQFCSQKKIECLFVSNWDPLPMHPAINLKNFYSKTLTEIINLSVKDQHTPWTRQDRLSKFIFPNSCHPNDGGHLIIGNALSEWIKEKINDKSVS